MPARLVVLSRERLLVVSLLLLVICVTNWTTVDAFQSIYLSHTRTPASQSPLVRPLAMTPSASTTIGNTPNWRILKEPTDETLAETVKILKDRNTWSDESYQDALDLYDRLTSCKDSYVAGAITVALNTLDHAFRLYGPESVICSFNGGKDAVVILHLVRAAHAQYCRQQAATALAQDKPVARLVRPRVVYWDHKDEFPDILSFLSESVESYDLDMISFQQGVKFAQGLKTLVDNNVPAGSNVAFPMAFVLGTRTTDPNAGQQGHFAPSSHFMPPFLRVNPVLEWTYGHVWHFLRLFQLPYCSLYDQGYTSLGTTKDTLPCPELLVPGEKGDGVPKFWPAYMLREWDQERAGRIPKDKKANVAVKKVETNATTAAGTSSEVSITSRASSANLSTMSEVRAVSAAAVVNKVPQEISANPASAATSKVAAEDGVSVVSYSADKVRQKSVGLVVIGDEILKGFTADTNTQAAAKSFRDQNVLLKRVVVVSDNQEEIVKEIERMRQKVDVIITSGGVGPTHDDVTIKSVAVALDSDLILHEEMAQLLRDKMNGGDGGGADRELTDAQTKMATIPSNSKLRYLSDNDQDWPVLQCRNIFILPGVPEFFAKKIENVAKYLSCQSFRSATFKVVLSVDENAIVPALNKVVENHPNVDFGSYPFVSHPDFKTVITVEARMMTTSMARSNSGIFDCDLIDQPRNEMNINVQLALDELLNTLPKGSILRVDNDELGLS